MSYRATVNNVGGVVGLPDYVYYNADIINNETKEVANGNVVIDPQVRFNEVRDAPLIRDASQYFFSIVRFSMDGSNKDLPLFIPVIQQSTGANNVNLTSYAVAISLQQTWNTTDVGAQTFTIQPAPRFIQYVPETQNQTLAPAPPPMTAVGAKGLYNAATVYQPDDIVWTALNIYGNGVAPFWKIARPAGAWSPTTVYGAGAWVSFSGQSWRSVGAPAPGVPPGSDPNWVIGVQGIAPGTAPFWIGVPDTLGSPQDLSTRYYWVYTYQHFIDLANQTLLDAYQDTYLAFQAAWAATGTADPFPFADFTAFQSYVNAPQIVFSPDTKRFRIFGDSDGFGKRIQTFTPTPAPAPLPHQTPPVCRLFFNSNMFGLFSNFDNTYWNEVRNTATLGAFGGATLSPPRPGNQNFIGYTNEILFPNKFWTNVVDYRLAPYAGVAPLGFVPPDCFGTNPFQQKPYWIAEQDYISVDSLWSPIGSIVFTSTLLPVRSEATGQPVVLGTSNTGFSSASTQSAFQPIITDIALDTSSEGADAYRSFIYYAPTAEYRLSDFTSSKQDIRNIDIQVFWKNRLDNNLYPITMFNCSSVSLKVMFRHKDATAGLKD
jgi:hypothetical protein